jgi:hypothetical protein
MARTDVCRAAIIVALLTATACSRPADGSVAAFSPVAPATLSSSAGGGTTTEALSGPAIGSVVPEGQALADASQFVSGGATTLTVQVKNVNLPDGTRLTVALDFLPVGTITLSRGEGTLVTSLGHFSVSNDQVRVAGSNGVILAGSFFR